MGDNKLCQGKDVFERMNFLYQASSMISKVDNVGGALYGMSMINCAKKSVLRIDVDVKRNLCKSCHNPLVPGETAIIRLRNKPKKSMKITCLICKSKKKLLTNKGYKIWSDNTDSVVTIFDYSAPENGNTAPEGNQTVDKNSEK